MTEKTIEKFPCTQVQGGLIFPVRELETKLGYLPGAFGNMARLAGNKGWRFEFRNKFYLTRSGITDIFYHKKLRKFNARLFVDALTEAFRKNRVARYELSVLPRTAVAKSRTATRRPKAVKYDPQLEPVIRGIGDTRDEVNNAVRNIILKDPSVSVRDKDMAIRKTWHNLVGRFEDDYGYPIHTVRKIRKDNNAKKFRRNYEDASFYAIIKDLGALDKFTAFLNGWIECRGR